MCVCGGVKLDAMSTFSVASVKKRSRGMFRLCALGTLTEKMRLNLKGQTLNIHSPAPPLSPSNPPPWRKTAVGQLMPLATYISRNACL